MQHDGKVVLFFPKLEPHKPYHWFPVSSLALAAPLVAHGLDVAIIDERVDPEWEARLVRECEHAICLGISAFTGYQLQGALRGARLAKECCPYLPVVWGGPHVTSLSLESIQSPLVDICVRGYGEHVVAELVTRLADRGSLQGLPGITYKDPEGDIHEEPLAPIKQKLHEVPRLPYELIDINNYINPETKAFIYLSSYGCPGICTFCSTPSFHCYAKLDLAKIFNDIDYLLAAYDYQSLVMYDATFFIEEARVLKIAEFLGTKRGIQKWTCDGRARDLFSIKDSTLELLERANLKRLVVGLESGSPRIIAIMKKGKDHLVKFKEVLKRLRQFDIEVISGVIFGIPGETIADLTLTLNFIKEIEAVNPKFRVSTTFFGPLPGTALYNEIRTHYDVKFPTTLEEWGELGLKNHYVYNRYVDSPFIASDIKDEYFKTYERFWQENQYLLT